MVLVCIIFNNFLLSEYNNEYDDKKWSSFHKIRITKMYNLNNQKNQQTNIFQR